MGKYVNIYIYEYESVSCSILLKASIRKMDWCSISRTVFGCFTQKTHILYSWLWKNIVASQLTWIWIEVGNPYPKEDQIACSTWYTLSWCWFSARYEKLVGYNYSSCCTRWDCMLQTIHCAMCCKITGISYHHQLLGNTQCKREQLNINLQSTKTNGRALVSMIACARSVLKIWGV